VNISELLSRPHDMNPGRAAPYLEGFATQMASVGYTSLTISGYIDSAIHFGGWLESRRLDFADVNEQTVQAFGAHRCDCPGRRIQKHLSRDYAARVQRFAEYLRKQGAIRAEETSGREGPSPLSTFCDWLLQHRGLCAFGEPA
jgi:integrase/recombinase XerD